MSGAIEEKKPCSTEFCQEAREPIDQYCFDTRVPPCSLVPMWDGSEVCYCSCPCNTCQATCLEKVAQVHGQLCSETHCRAIQEEINNYCDASGQPAGTPVPQVSPEGGRCYCCCDCVVGGGWLVEVAPGRKIPVEDLGRGDEALAGWLHENQLRWRRTPLDFVNGFGPGMAFDRVYYVAYRAEDGPQRFLVVPPDHLFLRRGGLTPVQLLAPGDDLLRPRGGVSRVELVCSARYTGSVMHLFFPGFEGEDLSGHLLSLHGTVSADFSVQLAYGVERLDPRWLHPNNGDALPVDHPEYRERYGDSAYHEFLSDPDQWPAGLTPHGAEVP